MSSPLANLKHTALLVLDIEPAILSMCPEKEAQRALHNSVRLVKAARAKGMTVALVRVAMTQQEFDEVPYRSKGFGRMKEKGLKSASDIGLGADDAGSQFHPDLDVQPDDIQIRKKRPGAFVNTTLQEQLQTRGIENLIITGVATSNAVLSAVRYGIDMDYGMVVVEDACADAEQEAHDFMVQKLFPKTTDVLSTEEVLKILA